MDMPTEILERILDFLHDSPEALRSTSLVSRRWVHASRYHLLDPTIIKEHSTPRRRIGLKENVSSFLSLVQSSRSTILPALRHVVLCILMPKLIRDIVEELKRAELLSQLDNSHIADALSVSWIAESLPRIRDFTYDASAAFRADAFSLVSSFPELQSLAIYTQIQTVITFPSHPVSGNHFRHLRTLRLRLMKSEQFMDWLQDGWHPALETFDLVVYRSSHTGWGPVDALNTFLKRNARTLKDLRLSTDFGDRGEKLSPGKETQVDLIENSNLTSLSLGAHDINAICDSLASLSPFSRLHCLTIDALEWRFSKEKCDCDPRLELLARLAGIFQGNRPFWNATLYLCVPSEFQSSDLGSVMELFGKWKERDAFSFSYANEDKYQINTRESLLSLIFCNSSD